MRDQFAGDISDLRKFAFLRAVTPKKSRLGIAWYYNADDDGTAAGKHLEHTKEHKWSLLDSDVQKALSQMKERNVVALERLSIWKENTVFYREAVATGLERSHWARRMYKVLEPTDVVFVDPDNGLGAATKLHATPDEVENLGRENRPVIMISFPHRKAKYPQQVEELHRLFDGHAITTVTTSVWIKQPRATWFSIINATESMNEAAQKFITCFNSIEHATADMHVSVAKR